MATIYFKDGTAFQTIINHYLFDKKLRFLILEAIERIEISIRAVISDTMSLSYGPHWYLHQEYFNDYQKHHNLIHHISEYCKDCNEQFIKSYKNNYKEPVLPPAWMITETLTFGNLSSLLEMLKDNSEKRLLLIHMG